MNVTPAVMSACRGNAATGGTPRRHRLHRRRRRLGHQYYIKLSEYYTAAPGGGGAAKGVEGAEGPLLGTNPAARVRLRRRETLEAEKFLGGSSA